MKRVLIYSHDTYGLGHLRRSLLIAQRLAEASPPVNVLIATGSPRAQAFELPKGVGTLQLPAVLKQADGTYRSRDLDIPIRRLLNMRSQLILSAWRDFRPDLVFVDHAPIGVGGELRPLLDALKKHPGDQRLVLGMRDIIDEADSVRRSWQKDGVMERLREDYDRVVVYGCSRFLTTAQELGLGELEDGSGEPKVRHVGYLARRMPRVRPSGRLLVMAGGGGDGHRLLRSVLTTLETRSAPLRFGVDVVTGPFLSDRRRKEIKERCDALKGDVNFVAFDPCMERRIAAAKGVISMAGYNSVVEILAARVPALLVPREKPRQEQLLRARRLAPLSGLDWCRQGDLGPEVIEGFFQRMESSRPEGQLCLNGLRRTRDELLALMELELRRRA